MIRPADLTPDDLLAAAATCRAALSPALDRDWEVRAHDLEWSCRRTLDHVADVLFLYAARVVARLFPWTPDDAPPWDALCWAAGRIALPGRERLGTDWFWHCAPLAEWDGTTKKRAAPPTWS